MNTRLLRDRTNGRYMLSIHDSRAWNIRTAERRAMLEYKRDMAVQRAQSLTEKTSAVVALASAAFLFLSLTITLIGGML